MKLRLWGVEQAHLENTSIKRGFSTYKEWLRAEENILPSLDQNGKSTLTESIWAGLSYSCSMLVISEIVISILGESTLPVPTFILASIVSYRFAVDSLASFLYPSSRKLEQDIHIRGQQIDSFNVINAKAERYHPPGLPGLLWGGLALPFELGQKHFLYVGTTGSGKTSSILLLMYSVLRQIGLTQPTPIPAPARAFIYDPKCDMVPRLNEMELKNYKIINPFDERGWAWDIASDCTDESTAKILAAAFAPDPPHRGGSEEFFQTACQNIIVRVLMFLNRTHKNKDWGLADLCQAAGNRDRLLAILKEPGYGVATDALLENKDVFAVLVNHMQKLESVANLWSRTDRKVSLREWMKQSEVLLLTFRQQRERDLLLIYPIMLRALIDIVLDEGKEREQTWFFLDEVQSFRSIPGLSKLMRMGRESGACVVLGMHDYEGFREIYGAHQTEEILGCCNHSTILKVLSPSTADWAARKFAVREYFEDERTTSETVSEENTRGHGVSFSPLDDSRTRSRNKSSSRGTSKGESNRRHKREGNVVLSGELIGQESVEQIQAIPAFYQGSVGNYTFNMSLDYVNEFSITQKMDTPGFLPTNKKDLIDEKVNKKWRYFDDKKLSNAADKSKVEPQKIKHEWTE